MVLSRRIFGFGKVRKAQPTPPPHRLAMLLQPNVSARAPWVTSRGIMGG